MEIKRQLVVRVRAQALMFESRNVSSSRQIILLQQLRVRQLAKHTSHGNVHIAPAYLENGTARWPHPLCARAKFLSLKMHSWLKKCQTPCNLLNWIGLNTSATGLSPRTTYQGSDHGLLEHLTPVTNQPFQNPRFATATRPPFATVQQ